jgi:hypothetical protein
MQFLFFKKHQLKKGKKFIALDIFLKFFKKEIKQKLDKS